MSRKAGVRVREGDKKQKQFAKANTECAKKYATALAQDQQLSRRQITHCAEIFTIANNSNETQQCQQLQQG